MNSSLQTRGGLCPYQQRPLNTRKDLCCYENRTDRTNHASGAGFGMMGRSHGPVKMKNSVPEVEQSCTCDYDARLRRQSVVREGPLVPIFGPGFSAPCFFMPFLIRSAIRLRSSSATAARMVKTNFP
jgi:hypothetical protein